MENRNTNIPKSFELGGTVYDVEIIPGSKLGSNACAQIQYAASKVVIADESNGIKCSDDFMTASFYHELVHGILETMGKRELSEDESFVEGFANLLHQYNNTKIFKDLNDGK